VALFGRKINNSEHQLTFVKYLRALADGEIEPEEAVRAYHGGLGKLGIKPIRSLADDLVHTKQASSYSGTTVPAQAAPAPARSAASIAPSGNGEPDFSRMTPAEKAMWNIERWKRILG